MEAALGTSESDNINWKITITGLFLRYSVFSYGFFKPRYKSHVFFMQSLLYPFFTNLLLCLENGTFAIWSQQAADNIKRDHINRLPLYLGDSFNHFKSSLFYIVSYPS